jgi:hypothetical protein
MHSRKQTNLAENDPGNAKNGPRQPDFWQTGTENLNKQNWCR